MSHFPLAAQKAPHQGRGGGGSGDEPSAGPHTRSSRSAVRWPGLRVSFREPRTWLPVLVGTHSGAGALEGLRHSSRRPVHGDHPSHRADTAHHTRVHCSLAGRTLDDSSFGHALPRSRKGGNGLSETVSLRLDGLPAGGPISLPRRSPVSRRKKSVANEEAAGRDRDGENAFLQFDSAFAGRTPKECARHAGVSRAQETRQRLIRAVARGSPQGVSLRPFPPFRSGRRGTWRRGKEARTEQRVPRLSGAPGPWRCSLCPPARVPRGAGWLLWEPGVRGRGKGRGGGGAILKREPRGCSVPPNLRTASLTHPGPGGSCCRSAESL